MTLQNYSKEQIATACIEVANDWRALAYSIRNQDNYAAHVTECVKDSHLKNMLLDADKIEAGEILSFTIAQRVHTKLTGECVPFMSI